jgi:uncharacterized protein HemX
VALKKTETLENDQKMTKTKVTKTKAPKADAEQHLSKIEKRAYELYLQRVSEGISGNDYTDWLKAEAEIKAKS